MSENSLSRTSETAPARTLAEIKISIQAHSRMAAESILQIGRDLIEAKQIAGHGGWLPFLADIGYKPSTAENWMRLAREIAPGSALAALSPTKALALLQLPQEEREAFAQEQNAQDKSAAELRRLIEERNRAAEAANAETARADAAEKRLEDAGKQAEQMARECDYYKGQAAQIEQERKAAERRAQELGRQLDELINQPVSIKTVEVEKVPADYEQMKQRLRWADQNVDDALAAATQAQERANQLEAELEQAKAQGGGRMEPEGLEALTQAVNQFITETQLMAVNPGALARREKEADALIRRLKLHVIELEKAIGDAAFAAEGAVL